MKRVKDYLYLIEYNQTRTKDMRMIPFDLIIVPTDGKREVEHSITTENLEDLQNFKDARTIEICFLDQTGFKELIKFVPKTLVSLSLFQCKDIKDLSPLEKLNNIEYLSFYWNRKATKLWNMTFTLSCKLYKWLIVIK